MTDTYDCRTQLGASRRRYEDALALYNARRWNGAIYVGGYAIECSLKSLICYINNSKRNFKDTPMYTGGARGAALHNLESLLKNAHIDASLMAALDQLGQSQRSMENCCKAMGQRWVALWGQSGTGKR